MKFLAAIAMALLLLGACKEKKTTETMTTPTTTSSTSTTVVTNMTPEELGQLGAEIKKKPAEAHRILSEHGLDEASFEKAIRKVSSSVEESRRYAAAYKKAS
jgi:hypothetical protein